MTKGTMAVVFFGVLAMAGLVLGLTLASGLLIPPSSVEAQPGPANCDLNTMAKLRQAINVLNSNPSPEAAEEAINHGMDELMGSRPLPTAAKRTNDGNGRNDGAVGADGFSSNESSDGTDGNSEENGSNGDTDRLLVPGSLEAHQRFSACEKVFAESLEKFASRGGRNVEHQGMALNAKQLVEEINQVAQNLSLITVQCGPGDIVLDDFDDSGNAIDNFVEHPCSQFQPLMNSMTGLENSEVFSANDTVFGQGQPLKPIDPLTRSYSVNLRADLVPPKWSRDIPEHVEITEALALGECSVVFKEFRGLLMQLHIEAITTVKDPGNKSGMAGTTSEPLWVLRWMPAQYGKQWIMCNKGPMTDPVVETTVTRQVIEDEGLIYFWRFYE